jgi:copper chaperone CopZ
MKKKRIQIEGMHCSSCSMLIEGELMDIGIEAICNYTRGYVDVSFDEKKVKEKDIIKVIKRLGYNVRDD